MVFDYEDKLLKLISEAGEDILDDDEMLNVLINVLEKSKEVNQKLEDLSQQKVIINE